MLGRRACLIVLTSVVPCAYAVPTTYMRMYPETLSAVWAGLERTLRDSRAHGVVIVSASKEEGKIETGWYILPVRSFFRDVRVALVLKLHKEQDGGATRLEVAAVFEERSFWGSSWKPSMPPGDAAIWASMFFDEVGKQARAASKG